MTMDDRVGMTPGWPASNNAMTSLLAQNWWAIALRGVLGIVLGIVAIVLPAVTIASLVLLLGARIIERNKSRLAAALLCVRITPFVCEKMLQCCQQK